MKYARDCDCGMRSVETGLITANAHTYTSPTLRKPTSSLHAGKTALTSTPDTYLGANAIRFFLRSRDFGLNQRKKKPTKFGTLVKIIWRVSLSKI